MTKQTLTRLTNQARLLLLSLAALCLTGCVTTKTVYVPVPCQPPESLLKQPESPKYLKQLHELLTPAPATQDGSKMPLIGPRI